MRSIPTEIGFIGAGRTATALASAMSAAGYRITAVSSLSHESAAALAKRLPGCSNVPSSNVVVEKCDVVLLTIPDDAIAIAASELAWREGQAVIHCSGALSIDALEAARQRGAMVGALHPYQTFPTGLDATKWLPGSTFAIESSGELHRWLKELVEQLQCRAVTVSANDKPLYHAAAVIGCGFITTLLDTAAALWETMGFSNEESTNAILSLASGTLSSIEAQGTKAVATGPVTRGDCGTIHRHMKALATRTPWALPLYKQTTLSMAEMVLRQGTITLDQAKEIEAVLNTSMQPFSKDTLCAEKQ